MADPLSVTASVVGLVTAAGQITSLLYQFINSVQDAPSLANHVMIEVHSINSVICSLQPFLWGQARASKPQEDMILIEDLIITLTGCVCTFSELELVVKGLGSDDGMNTMDRVRWARKEGTIRQLFERLQIQKSSLTLMLTILESKSTEQAGKSLGKLCELVSQVVESQKDMAERMRRIEAGPYQAFMGRNSLSIRPGTSGQASIRSMRSIGSYENVLHVTRVYRRAFFKNQRQSTLTVATQVTERSILSGISLSEISNISVFNLPVYSSEISNRQYYSFGRNVEGNTSGDGFGRTTGSGKKIASKVQVLGRAGISTRVAVSQSAAMAAPEQKPASQFPSWPTLRLKPSIKQLLRHKSKFTLQSTSEFQTMGNLEGAAMPYQEVIYEGDLMPGLDRLTVGLSIQRPSKPLPPLPPLPSRTKFQGSYMEFPLPGGESEEDLIKHELLPNNDRPLLSQETPPIPGGWTRETLVKDELFPQESLLVYSLGKRAVLTTPGIELAEMHSAVLQTDNSQQPAPSFPTETGINIPAFPMGGNEGDTLSKVFNPATSVAGGRLTSKTMLLYGIRHHPAAGDLYIPQEIKDYTIDQIFKLAEKVNGSQGNARRNTI